MKVPKHTAIYFSVAPGQDEEDVLDGAGGDSIALNVSGLEKPSTTKMSVSLYGLSLDQVWTLTQYFTIQKIASALRRQLTTDHCSRLLLLQEQFGCAQAIAVNAS